MNRDPALVKHASPAASDHQTTNGPICTTAPSLRPRDLSRFLTRPTRIPTGWKTFTVLRRFLTFAIGPKWNASPARWRASKIPFNLPPDPASARALFDAALPDTAIFLREYKPFSGTINPSALIKKLHLATRFKGSKIRYHTKVISLKKRDGLYEVVTENVLSGRRETLYSHRIAAAAGPYNGELLKDLAPYFNKLISPERVFLGFFRLHPEIFVALSPSDRAKLLRSYPVINSTAGTREGANFSMIEHFDEKGNPLIKIGGHFQRSAIDDLDNIWQQELSPGEIAWSKEHILRYFSIIDLPVKPTDLLYETGYSCVYSLSSNEVPYVTPIHTNGGPDNQAVVLGAMSGVGAKGALAYGLLAANWLLDQHESSKPYENIRKVMGYQRLLEDLKSLH